MCIRDSAAAVPQRVASDDVAAAAPPPVPSPMPPPTPRSQTSRRDPWRHEQHGPAGSDTPSASAPLSSTTGAAPAANAPGGDDNHAMDMAMFDGGLLGAEGMYSFWPVDSDVFNMHGYREDFDVWLGAARTAAAGGAAVGPGGQGAGWSSMMVVEGLDANGVDFLSRCL